MDYPQMSRGPAYQKVPHTAARTQATKPEEDQLACCIHIQLPPSNLEDNMARQLRGQASHRHTASRTDDLAVTRVLVGTTLEADREDRNEGHCAVFSTPDGRG